MKASHARILAALAYGATVVRLGRSKIAHVSFPAGLNAEPSTVRVSTLWEMELLKLIRCVDQYTDADTEWTLPEKPTQNSESAF